MHPNSVGVAGLSCARRTDPGVSMKRIFGWLANGPIYIEWCIPLAIRLISCSTRDAGAAKQFFQRALQSANHPGPRVGDVDWNPAYPRAIEELKCTRELGRRCRCRP